MSKTEKHKVEKYYIGCCRCHQVKYGDGSVATKDDTIGWFGESEGYASVQTDKVRAYRYATEAAARKGARIQDGMPWMYRFKPDTLQIFYVECTTITTIVENEVEIKS